MNKINKEAEHEVVKQKIRKTQKDWIPYFNDKKLKMISAPDIYTVFKEGKDKKLMESLREDMLQSIIVTSTRVKFDNETLKAKIIHDFGSIVVSQKEIEVEIPGYSGYPDKDEKLEKFFQVLYDTQDQLSDILAVLKSVDPSKKLWNYTPSQLSRRNTPERAVWLCFVDDDFIVYCNNWIDDLSGGSRGVRVDSAAVRG